MDSQKYMEEKCDLASSDKVAVVPQSNFANAPQFQQLDNDYQQQFPNSYHQHPNPPVYPALPTCPSAIPDTTPQPQQQKSVNLVIARPGQHKSLAEAYILWLPLGLLGLHHFYLRRYGFGLLYFFTLGVGGVGWLVDLVRMPQLVKDANRKIDHPEEFQPISVADAYITWFPFGILGLHHYYLRRPLWGVAYTFTCGFFGIGWLIDACRIPSLVRQTNERLMRERFETHDRHARLCDAYILGLTPCGIFGAHHFYLGNCAFGVFYVFTAGGAGIGWIVDWFRMKWLVDRCNHPDRHILGKRHKFVDDAYVLAVPFGILGAHHFYLERPIWGVLYLFTLGLGGIGWLIDLARMPCLVNDTNKRLEDDLRMIVEIRHQLGGGQCDVQQRKICVYAEQAAATQPLSVAQQGYGAMATPYDPTGPQPPPPYTPSATGYMHPGPVASEHEIPPAYMNKGFVDTKP